MLHPYFERKNDKVFTFNIWDTYERKYVKGLSNHYRRTYNDFERRKYIFTTKRQTALKLSRAILWHE